MAFEKDGLKSLNESMSYCLLYQLVSHKEQAARYILTDLHIKILGIFLLQFLFRHMTNKIVFTLHVYFARSDAH